ncbi:Protein BTG2 [Frankliniella fusca]|uniref:Protein BTG2 n=1 Tax=Frankliniella fusca TaxID=407009 RepID=A0AAE1GVC9_9NEOP|nr:Protein BTG2 [Frankliniella fusca]
MRLEIHSAVNFLVQLLRLHHNGLSESQLEMFKGSLSELLSHRYRYHWFPDRPHRGSAYRCLRINGSMDPVIAEAGDAVGLPGSYLHRLFPSELTMWIDPAEVSYRIGENGSICVLYEDLRNEPTAIVTLPHEQELLMERVGNKALPTRPLQHGMHVPHQTVQQKYDLSTYASS